MDIVKHPICNMTLAAPSDMQQGNGIDQGTCASLPIYQYENSEGPWAVSFWKPSLEDLQTLINGGYIALQVRAKGRQHPVVALGTSVFDKDAEVCKDDIPAQPS